MGNRKCAVFKIKPPVCRLKSAKLVLSVDQQKVSDNISDICMFILSSQGHFEITVHSVVNLVLL